MSIDHRKALESLRALLKAHAPADLLRKLSPKHHERAARIPSGSEITAESVDARWAVLAKPDARKQLLDDHTAGHASAYARNIENFVGTVKVPVGIAGPLRVNGSHAQGDFYVPLATTEAALVASYSRGAQLITEAGGCVAITTNESVSRAPGFAFPRLADAGAFVAWVLEHTDDLRKVAESTTRHGKLNDLRVNLEGNHVYLVLEYSTGDASGQNIVTIASQAVCEYLARECPVKALYQFVEANSSGDKKPSSQSFLTGRGRSVVAEVIVPEAMVQARLHTPSDMIEKYWKMSAVGAMLSGTMGVQGHYANCLAAIYMACGQDVACVAESAAGITRLESTAEGLYASVTLPSLIVGTVGGGTGLPSQRAGLDILGLAGAGHANAFAEVCAAISLAGEISIAGALAAGHFTSAHQRLARGPSGGGTTGA
jgi:hydroxymethylglutaryl-CoA reductase (NADPH)